MVTGLEPARPQVIPDSAFQPVVIPSLHPAALPAPVPSPDERPVFDSVIEADPPVPRAQPQLPVASAIVVPVATPRPTSKPTPAPTSGSTTSTTTHSISGLASWYCRAGISACTVNHPDTTGFNAYAAAGPRLRRALGSDWRGSIVYVDGVRVKIIDWCQCYEGQPNEKLLDLYYDVFARVGSTVRIRW